jgi:hypothetical protein
LFDESSALEYAAENILPGILLSQKQCIAAKTLCVFGFNKIL